MAFGLISLLQIFAAVSFGQTTPPPRSEKTNVFGTSLQRYDQRRPNVKRDGEINEQRDGDKNEPSDSETIRVKTNLVVNNILVTDKNGLTIANLHKSDFVVTENEAPQAIEVFSAGESASLPNSIVLIIDYSGSQAPFIDNSIQAAELLVDKLRARDKMAIVTDDINLLVDFTTDKIVLKNALESLKNNVSKDKKTGRSRQFSALLAVLNEMFDETNLRPTIIFQTDGDEIATLKPNSDAPDQILDANRMRFRNALITENFGLSDIRASLDRSRATIYSIVSGIPFLGLSKQERLTRAKILMEQQLKALGLGNRNLPKMTNELLEIEADRSEAAQSAMFNLAELSGGETSFLEKSQDADGIYSKILNRINNRYSIGYYPTNENLDGKRRTVKIEVRNHPEYVVTGRKNYVAAGSQQE